MMEGGMREGGRGDRTVSTFWLQVLLGQNLTEPLRPQD